MTPPATENDKDSMDGSESQQAVSGAPLGAWAGLVCGPVVFLFNVLSSFSIAPWAGETGEHWTMYIFCSASVLLVSISGWLALRVWRHPGNHVQQQFAGFMGVLVAVFFVVAVIAVWFPHTAGPRQL